MIKKVGTFLVGVAVGAMLMSSTFASAATQTSIDVYMKVMNFIVDGKVVKTSAKPGMYYNGKEYVPSAFIYKGTTYVPYRFAGESLGKQVKYDSARNAIIIQDAAEIGGKEVTMNVESLQSVPQEIKAWVESTSGKRYTGSKNFGGRTYILFRSAVPNPGYGYQITAVNEQEKAVAVSVKQTQPNPDMMYPQVISYPYALISIAQTDKPVTFTGDTADMMNEQTH